MLAYLNNIILCAVATGALLLPGEESVGTATQRKSLPLADQTLFARTLLGECGRCGDAEVKAIGWVIKNRLRSRRYGKEIADVVTYKRRGVYAFSTWERRWRNEATGPHVDRSKAFIRAWGLAEAVWQEERDPTGGAVNYWHPAAFKPRGGKPYWVKNRIGQRIGGALFYR